MTAMEDVVQTVRQVRQEVLPYLDFATQVSALAVRLAERGDPVALDLWEVCIDNTYVQRVYSDG